MRSLLHAVDFIVSKRFSLSFKNVDKLKNWIQIDETEKQKFRQKITIKMLWGVGSDKGFHYSYKYINVISIVFIVLFCCTLSNVPFCHADISEVILDAQLANDDFSTTIPDNYGHCSESRKDSVTISSQPNNEGSFCSSKVKHDDVVNPLWHELSQKIKLAQNEINDDLSCSEKEDFDSSRACRCYTDLITIDLKPFSSGITKEMIENLRGRGTLYQILDGKLYREKNCKFPVRCTGIEHFLKQIAKGLPNMEFVINVSDWPVGLKKSGLSKAPIFSFSKTSDFSDITYPAWAFWEGGPAEKITWNDKKSVGFFRGSRTSNERDALVILSRQNPDIVDAQYTKNQAWKSDADTLNVPAAKEVSFEKHCDYKYLFNYRGVAASFRFKHLFLCRSLVFHVGDEWTEYFYHALKPWIHYIPVPKNADQDTLKSYLEFFIANDNIARKIAENGYSFIKSNLQLHHVSCYWKELLRQYAKLINYKITPRQDFMLLK